VNWLPAERAVINTSPLIFLSRSRHLDLLQIFAKQIWVSEQVTEEIRHREAQDITAQAIEENFVVQGGSTRPRIIRPSG